MSKNRSYHVHMDDIKKRGSLRVAGNVSFDSRHDAVGHILEVFATRRPSIFFFVPLLNDLRILSGEIIFGHSLGDTLRSLIQFSYLFIGNAGVSASDDGRRVASANRRAGKNLVKLVTRQYAGGARRPHHALPPERNIKTDSLDDIARPGFALTVAHPIQRGFHKAA